MSTEVTTKRVMIEGREFLIGVLKIRNGCFLIVSEGSELRMGSLSLSLKTGEKVNSSSLIPNKFAALLNTMLGEMAANLIRGIIVTSLYVVRNLEPQSAKTLLSEVRSML